MLLSTKNSDKPQRLHDAYKMFEAVTVYFEEAFIELIHELEDHKGLLMVTIYRRSYNKLNQHEKDIFQERLENIWKLYNLEDIEIVYTDGEFVYQSWHRSPRARRSPLA